jgi:hypothetical protein
MSGLPGILYPLTSKTKVKVHVKVFPFWPVASAWLKLHCLSTGQTIRLVLRNRSPRVVLRNHQDPELGLSTLAFMFSFPFAAAFSPSLFSKCTKRYCMCVHACFHQTALSSVPGAPPYIPSLSGGDFMQALYTPN